MYFTYNSPIRRFTEEAALAVNDVKMMRFMRNNNPAFYDDLYEAFNYAETPNETKEMFQHMQDSMHRDNVVKSILHHGIEVRTATEIAKGTTLKPIEEDHRKFKVIEGLHDGTIDYMDISYMRASVMRRNADTAREEYEKKSADRADAAIRKVLYPTPIVVG